MREKFSDSMTFSENFLNEEIFEDELFEKYLVKTERKFG